MSHTHDKLKVNNDKLKVRAQTSLNSECESVMKIKKMDVVSIEVKKPNRSSSLKKRNNNINVSNKGSNLLTQSNGNSP